MNLQIQNSLATLITHEKLNQLLNVTFSIFVIICLIGITYVIISHTIKLIRNYRAYHKQHPYSNGDVLFYTIILLFISWSGYSVVCYWIIRWLIQ